MISLTAILALIGSAIAAIAGAFGYGRISGATAAKKDVAAEAATAELQTRKRIDNAVDAATGPDADADREWLRARGGDQR